MTSKGVIYCALHSFPYLEAALTSALALRRLEPDLPILLLSDFPDLATLPLASFGIQATIVQFSPTANSSPILASRLLKVSLPDFTNFDDTLYLDADVLPILPIGEIWDYLKQGSVALAVDQTPTVGQCAHVAQNELDYTLEQCPATFPQFNSGVFLWHRDAQSLGLFQAWKQEWHYFQRHDQLALARAIHRTATPIVPLSPFYNFPASQVTTDVIRHNQVRLLHCLGGFITARRFKPLAQRLVPKAVAQAEVLLKQSPLAPLLNAESFQ